MKDKDQIRSQILDLVKQYYELAFAETPFTPGLTRIRYGAKVFDHEEMTLLVESALHFWLTSGPYAARFEKGLKDFVGANHASLVNSGSSANLLALTALTSRKLGDKQLKPGDEVITVASGFPTTVNPIVQNGLTPVFCDVNIPTYNVKVDDLQGAVGPRTRAVMLAHTLGNPFNLNAVTELAEENELWLIEDCCDALGSKYDGVMVGSFGHLSTFSFYPPHHITMGEGGCVLTDDPLLKRVVDSLRDWGRDCWCNPGEDNRCGKRFQQQHGDLPYGYDHKYVYSHIGYNLKATDMQAAVGLAQLGKLPDFIEKRKVNFKHLYGQLKGLDDYFILPQKEELSDPSWFGFPLAVRREAGFTRNEIAAYLEEKQITIRLLFGGNMTRQPAYADVKYRRVSDLSNSDFVMNNVFWVGVYPGITPEMIRYVASTFERFVGERI